MGKGAVNPGQLAIDHDKIGQIAGAIGLDRRCWRSLPKNEGDVQQVKNSVRPRSLVPAKGSGALLPQPIEQAVQVCGELAGLDFTLNAGFADLVFTGEE